MLQRNNKRLLPIIIALLLIITVIFAYSFKDKSDVSSAERAFPVQNVLFKYETNNAEVFVFQSTDNGVYISKIKKICILGQFRYFNLVSSGPGINTVGCEKIGSSLIYCIGDDKLTKDEKYSQYEKKQYSISYYSNDVHYTIPITIIDKTNKGTVYISVDNQ